MDPFWLFFLLCKYFHDVICTWLCVCEQLYEKVFVCFGSLGQHMLMTKRVMICFLRFFVFLVFFLFFSLCWKGEGKGGGTCVSTYMLLLLPCLQFPPPPLWGKGVGGTRAIALSIIIFAIVSVRLQISISSKKTPKAKGPRVCAIISDTKTRRVLHLRAAFSLLVG